MLYSDTNLSSDFESYRSDESENEFTFGSRSDEVFSESTVLYSSDSSLNFDDSQSNHEGIKIWYTNADSYLNKREEMLVEIELQKPDIIVITEWFPKTTNATDLDLVEFSIEGFSLYISKVEEKSRGVGIYVNETLSSTECSVLNNCNFKESCWYEIILKNNDKLLIGAIYRSPSSGTANNLKLNQMISTAVGLNHSYLVVLGDFNYPGINWTDWTTIHNESHSEFLFIECLRDNFLSQEIQNPTRHRIGQTANILDLLLVNKSEIVSDLNVSSGLGASDHLAYNTYLLCKPEFTDSETMKFNFHKGDYVSINEDLKQVDWEQLHNLNVQESWIFFP